MYKKNIEHVETYLFNLLVSKIELQRELHEFKIGLEKLEKMLDDHHKHTSKAITKAGDNKESDSSGSVNSDNSSSNNEDEDNQDQFGMVIREFYKEATKQFGQLKDLLEKASAAYDSTARFYGEQPEKTQPDAFFGIFREFNISWQVIYFSLLALYCINILTVLYQTITNVSTYIYI